MTTAERYNLIIQAEKYSEQEAHDVATLLCIIRDTRRNEIKEGCEKALQIFITKKKLGDPVSIKKIREDCGVL
jgi:hypothetical protein